MSDVAGRFIADSLDVLERRGLDVASLLDGLPIERVELRNGFPNIDWNVFVDLMQHIEEHVGGPAELEKVGEWVGDLRIAPLLRKLVGLSASP